MQLETPEQLQGFSPNAIQVVSNLIQSHKEGTVQEFFFLTGQRNAEDERAGVLRSRRRTSYYLDGAQAIVDSTHQELP